MWVTKLSTAIEGSTGAADTVAGASHGSTSLSRERQLPARNPLLCLLMRDGALRQTKKTREAVPTPPPPLPLAPHPASRLGCGTLLARRPTTLTRHRLTGPPWKCCRGPVASQCRPRHPQGQHPLQPQLQVPVTTVPQLPPRVCARLVQQVKRRQRLLRRRPRERRSDSDRQRCVESSCRTRCVRHQSHPRYRRYPVSTSAPVTAAAAVGEEQRRGRRGSHDVVDVPLDAAVSSSAAHRRRRPVPQRHRHCCCSGCRRGQTTVRP